jgi:thiamine biosynthesis protein ThiI
VFSVVLVRYGEIALKSPFVRKNLERKLRQNFVSLLRSRSIPFDKVTYDLGRFFIHTKKAQDIAVFIANHVFGVVSTSACLEVKNEIPEITRGIITLATTILPKKATFAISARRTGKHSFSSQDVAVEGGKAILENFKKKTLKVNLSNPDYTIYVETRQKSTYIYHSVQPGLGGLPGKTQGRLVGLLDHHGASTMAIWLAMRRGAVIDILFFKGDKERTGDILTLAKYLLKFLPEGNLSLREIDASKQYQKIKGKFPQQSDLLWRRYQIRVMSSFASKRRSLGIVLGGSLSKQSSTTLKWIELTDGASNYPIYRPLLALPKELVNDFWKKISPSELPSNFESPIPGALASHLEISSQEQVIEWEKTLNLDDREVLERSVQYKLNEEG